MKTLAAIVLCMSIMSCGIISPPTFDSVEYNELVQIVVETSEGTCQPAQTEKLSALSKHLKVYTRYLPNNDLTSKSVADMDVTIQELHAKGEVAPIVCALKLRAIHFMATEIARVSGGKLR